MTFDSTRFGEGVPRGALGLALLFAFPFALGLLRERRASVRLLILGAYGYLVLLFYTSQYSRYYVMILPLIAVLGVATVFRLAPPSAHRFVRISVLVVIIVQPLISPLQFWNIPERFPVTVALGIESRDAFLRRALHGYAAAAYLNGVSGPDDKILGADTENLRFYLRSPLETLPVAPLGSPVRTLAEMSPGPALLVAMKQAGFRHLFVTRAAAKNPFNFSYLDKDFLQVNAQLEFADDDALVFRLP